MPDENVIDWAAVLNPPRRTPALPEANGWYLHEAPCRHPPVHRDPRWPQFCNGCGVTLLLAGA